MKLRTYLLAAAFAVLGVTSASAQTVLKVGMSPTGTPFTFLDTKTNSLRGVMVDVLKAIEEDSGMQMQLEPLAFSSLIGSLTSKRIDVIATAMFITPKRAEVVDFSQVVYGYGEGLEVPKTDTTQYTSFADLKGKTVGVAIGTAYVEPLQKAGVFKEVRIYDNTQELQRDVNAGRIDAAFVDYPIGAYGIASGLYPNIQMVKSYKPVLPGEIGIATRKGDAELMDKINASLTKLKSNGKLAAILKKWGLE